MQLELGADGPGPTPPASHPVRDDKQIHGLVIPAHGGHHGRQWRKLSSGDDSGNVESLQSWEIEASRSLAELFREAAVHFQGLVQVACREQLLYLYARYKQVRAGNCNTPKPSFFDFKGKQKWEAWKALGDSSPSPAEMQEHVL